MQPIIYPQKQPKLKMQTKENANVSEVESEIKPPNRRTVGLCNGNGIIYIFAGKGKSHAHSDMWYIDGMIIISLYLLIYQYNILL